MKVKSLKLIYLCCTLFAFADSNSTFSSVDNNSDISSLKERSKLSEIQALKKRVTTLEAELEIYKKVKPGTVKLLSVAKPIVETETKRGKRYVLSMKAPQTLPVYYEADLMSIEHLIFKLERNGFILLSQDEIFKGKVVLSFTNKALTETNSFISVLHLLVNEGKEIRVQNPDYFAAAFLQDKYQYGDLNSTLKALDVALGGMYEVTEKYSLSELSAYHFMIGMPRVGDTILLASGENLVSKIDDVNVSKYISFILTLPNGNTLVGHKLRQSTYAYLKKIKAENNAQLFPYHVMISKGKALMLAPKYYLALALPFLSMTDFLQIASAPEDIVKDIKQVYK